MLTRVEISGYRCLREVDVPLKPLTVLIGPNNTGKTAFLSAIQLLGTVGKPNVEGRIKEHDLWRFQWSTPAAVVGYADLDNMLGIERGPIQNSNIENRKAWVRSGVLSDVVAPVNLFETLLEPAMQSHGTEAKGGIPEIDDRATNVPAYLDVLLRRDRRRFFQTVDRLKDLIPGLCDVNIETPSVQDRRIDLVFEDGFTMDAKFASYGVKLMIFFVALANHPEPPVTILLEEPETGVHPKRLEDIVRLLISLSEGSLADRPTQVILTTHSPYLLDWINPIKHQVLVFERGPDGACSARPVDTERLKPFLSEYMLGEVWQNQEEAGLVERVR